MNKIKSAVSVLGVAAMTATAMAYGGGAHWGYSARRVRKTGENLMLNM